MRIFWMFASSFLGFALTITNNPHAAEVRGAKTPVKQIVSDVIEPALGVSRGVRMWKALLG